MHWFWTERYCRWEENRLTYLKAQDSSVYVMLLQLYAGEKKWDDYKRIRALMDERCVTKTPAKSWIEVNAKVSYFLVGDKSHPLAAQIHKQLDEVKTRLKQLGTITEEQKSDAVRHHSEQLALAYGLLKLPPKQQITIINNLRICLDCHNFLEHASKAYNRAIVVRDPNRFHHFIDGECSCSGHL